MDWLLSKGYDDHPYTVDEISGHRHLWLTCREKLETVIRYTKQNKRQARGNKYAEEHGLHHLEWLTRRDLRYSCEGLGKFLFFNIFFFSVTIFKHSNLVIFKN